MVRKKAVVGVMEQGIDRRLRPETMKLEKRSVSVQWLPLTVARGNQTLWLFSWGEMLV